MEIFGPSRPPAAAKRKRIHAAPTELGGSCGTCDYKHGAPDGAGRIAAATPPLRERCAKRIARTGAPLWCGQDAALGNGLFYGIRWTNLEAIICVCSVTTCDAGRLSN